MKRPIDMWEDKERCCYCKWHDIEGKQRYCHNEESDYCGDWTELSFGCEKFEMSDYYKAELARSEKEKEKKNGTAKRIKGEHGEKNAR